jgi:hypothetical protein
MMAHWVTLDSSFWGAGCLTIIDTEGCSGLRPLRRGQAASSCSSGRPRADRWRPLSTAKAGRAITGGDHPGDGADNPYKVPRIAGFPLTDGDRDDLLAFLEAMSDPSVLEGGDIADPFCRDDDTGLEDCIVPRDLESDDVEG